MGNSRSVDEYIITNFTAGELSPKFRGRIDVEQYTQGGETIRNGIVMPQGGVTRRPGMLYGTELSTDDIRLIPFEVSKTETYVVVLKPLLIEIYNTTSFSGTALSATSTLWTSSEIHDVKFANEGPIMWLVHNAHLPKKLSRTALNTFTFANMASGDFTDWPASWAADSPITANHYPGAVTLYESRLIFGGSETYPLYYWGSRSGEYDQWDYPTVVADRTESDSYEKAVAIPGASKIQWLRGMGPLFLGTDAGVATKSSRQELMTSLSGSFSLIASMYGASEHQGFLMGGEVFYIQNDDRTIRVAMYQGETESYLSPSIVYQADHITKSKIVSAAFTYAPEPLLWIVLEDGTFASMAYDPSNGVSAWSTHETDGDVLDVAVVGNGDQQTAWFAVDRDGTVSLEYLAELFPDDQKELCFLDSSVMHDAGATLDITSIAESAVTIGGTAYIGALVTLTSGTLVNGDYVRFHNTGNTEFDYKTFVVSDWSSPAFKLKHLTSGEYATFTTFTTITTGDCQKVVEEVTGLTHLEGLEVDYFSDGGDGGTGTVTSGTLALGFKANKINIGIGYDSYIVPMNLAAGKTRKKRIVEISAEVMDSLGGRAGKDIDNTDPFPVTSTITLDEVPTYNNGTVKIPFRGGSEFNGDMIILQDRPLPLTVLSIICHLEMGD